MPRASWWILLTGAGLVGALLALPRVASPPLLGQAIGGAVLLYHVVFVAGAWLRHDAAALRAWFFLAPLSVLQVLPDWLLSEFLGVLAFPDLGGDRVGPVPMYMAGLWVTPLLVVLWFGEAVEARAPRLATLVAAAASLGVFAGAEWAAPGYGLWAPRHVATLHGVAPYILPAEAALGAAAWLAWCSVRDAGVLRRLVAAACVTTFYTGAAALSLLVSTRLV